MRGGLNMDAWIAFAFGIIVGTALSIFVLALACAVIQEGSLFRRFERGMMDEQNDKG